ncbi:DUF3142 domain-containing protein [Klebsiella sp. BIGb0407]|uniref:DUF3142 domain-containing protein n=1 Tax=Klebsiella sp. BIGb0407 TaxID=2940603 RepID=UPI0021680AC8|nr:DUF3142 domain-containing protein [Klebsiella sp. BIGb0407]MCS3429567.1 hypothetical protein [Klebsiella sp. BIGb0407]
MGAKTQILLVGLLIAGLFSFPAHARVNAEEHRAFWLWSGVKPGEALRQAQVVYLHQGELVTRSGRVVFERVGLPVSRLTFPRIWLTVRITTLDMPADAWRRIILLLDRWEIAGNQVVGLQIDFDAATHRLNDYAAFLREIRQQLPARYALGVTGLLDWAKTGDISTLNTLPIDEIVVQSYQGRHTVTDYSQYLPALSKLKIPFSIGLVQHGDWDDQYEKSLANSPWYRGTVVFMLRNKTEH